MKSWSTKTLNDFDRILPADTSILVLFRGDDAVKGGCKSDLPATLCFCHFINCFYYVLKFHKNKI